MDEAGDADADANGDVDVAEVAIASLAWTMMAMRPLMLSMTKSSFAC